MKCELFAPDSARMRALHYVPDAVSTAGNPVLLYLHGKSGFVGGESGLYDYPDFPSLLRDGMQLECRVLIPICQHGQRWEPSSIATFLDEYEHMYGASGSRYDVIGFSRGGTGAYHFAAEYNSRVRTVTAVAARPALDAASELTMIPVLICHGAKDQVVAVTDARLMHDTLQRAGCPSTLLLIDGDHYIIASVLRSRSIFDWQQKALR